jgi:hypothetical protein
MSFKVCEQFVPKEFHAVLNHTRTQSIFNEKKLKDSKNLLKFFDALLKNKWQSNEKLKALTLACRQVVGKKELHGDAKKTKEKLLVVYHNAKKADKKPVQGSPAPVSTQLTEALAAKKKAEAEVEKLKKQIETLTNAQKTKPVVEPVKQVSMGPIISTTSQTGTKPVDAISSSALISTSSVPASSTQATPSTFSFEGYTDSIFPTLAQISPSTASVILSSPASSTSQETSAASTSASSTASTTTTVIPSKRKNKRTQIVNAFSTQPSTQPSIHQMTTRSKAKQTTAVQDQSK